MKTGASIQACMSSYILPGVVLKKNNPKYYEIFDDADMDSGYGIGVIIK